MKKEQVLQRLKEDCLVAVVRAENLEKGEKVIDAIIEGGINFIEICMTVDEGSPIDLVSNIVKKYKDNDKVVVGAGTVLDPETARMASSRARATLSAPALTLTPSRCATVIVYPVCRAS